MIKCERETKRDNSNEKSRGSVTKQHTHNHLKRYMFVYIERSFGLLSLFRCRRCRRRRRHRRRRRSHCQCCCVFSCRRLIACFVVLC